MSYTGNGGPQRPRKDSYVNKAKKRKRKKKGKVFLSILIVLIIVGVFSFAGIFLGAYAGIAKNSPDFNIEEIMPESFTSILYDANGNEFDKLHGKENREYVKLSAIPLNLQRAVVAIEDERFYKHGGIDLKGILRAMAINIKEMNFSQGASTITQQLVKNEMLDSEKTITRKIQEQFLSVRLEKELTKKLNSKTDAKNYILELYLNTIALNHGLNGVEAASKFYWGKEVGELTLAQCASLAGITKNPSLYSPVTHPDENKKRQKTVLDKMLELDYITKEEYDNALAEDIYTDLVAKSNDGTGNALHNYFVDSLIVALADDLVTLKGYNKKQAYDLIYSGGLQIYTTLDQGMQDIMEESFKNDAFFPPLGSNPIDASYTISVEDNETKEQSHTSRRKIVKTKEEAEAFAEEVKKEVLNSTNTFVLDKLTVSGVQAAMSVMDYHNGYVKAIVGGRGEKDGDLVFNRATQALRQPGSCFKVLAAYAPAMDLGIISAGSVIVDEPFTYQGWSPKNWYKGYRGPCTARDGVRDSLNILAAKVITMVGVDKAFEYLLDFGFTSLVDKVDENGHTDRVASASLGGLTKGVSVLELTAAYGAIANGGEYIKPVFYEKVLDHDGNVIFDNTNPVPKKVIKPSTAWILTDMMRDVITGGGTGGLARFKNVRMPIAGKTGTTTDDKDLVFAGYTPYYVAGIWMGYDMPRKLNYGKSYHLLLWSDVMEKIHQNLPEKNFPRPDGITMITACGISGKSPVAGLCEHDYYGNKVVSDYAVSGTSGPNGECTVHKKFKIDITTGKLAGPNCPPEIVKEVVLAVDADNNILNMPTEIPEGKVKINLHETCTDLHTDIENPSDIIIGGDNNGNHNGNNNGNHNGNNTNNPSTNPDITPPEGGQFDPETDGDINIDAGNGFVIGGQ